MNKEVRITLKQHEDKVILHAVDKDGEHLPGGNILELTGEGSIVRYGGVSHNLGLNVGVDGRVVDETRI